MNQLSAQLYRSLPTEPGVPDVDTPQVLSCQSVNVSWTPPTNGRIPLTGYTVRYGDSREQTEEGNTTLAMLDGLAPNTTYNITIAAWNAIGEGAESTSVSVMTESRHLGSFVTARALTSDTVLINTTQEEGFSNCSLPMSPHGSQSFTPPIKVSRLQPNTNYTVVCDVYNSASIIDPCIYSNTSVLTSEIVLIYIDTVLKHNDNTRNCTIDYYALTPEYSNSSLAIPYV